MSTLPYNKYPLGDPNPQSGFDKYLWRDLDITVKWIKQYCWQNGQLCPYCDHVHQPTEDCKES